MLHQTARLRLFAVMLTGPLVRSVADWRTRRAARARIRALLARRDDHLIDDIGITRDGLCRRFGLRDGM